MEDEHVGEVVWCEVRWLLLPGLACLSDTRDLVVEGTRKGNKGIHA